MGVALGIGSALQLAMVVGGHFSPAIAALFAVAGMLISMLAGGMFGEASGTPRRRAVGGGALVGGACALIGIAVSVALGDVPPAILLFGTASSAVTGALGGWVGMALRGRRSALA
jgi:hypothetical protein